MALLAFRRLSTVANTQIGGAGSAAVLHKVLVNKATATAIVNVYNGTSSSDPQIASIDAGSAPREIDFGGLICPKGIFVDQITAAGDITIVYA